VTFCPIVPWGSSAVSLQSCSARVAFRGRALPMPPITAQLDSASVVQDPVWTHTGAAPDWLYGCDGIAVESLSIPFDSYLLK
jgi:hypothetical protein